jgi:putative membrane protein
MPAGPAARTLTAGPDRGVVTMMWTGWGWMGAMGWLGMVLAGLLTLAAVAAVTYGVIRTARRVPGPDPEELLARRFARGEIDEQEYRTRLEVLSGER